MQKSNAAEQREETEKGSFFPVPGYTDQGMTEVLERALPAVRKLLDIVRG